MEGAETGLKAPSFVFLCFGHSSLAHAEPSPVSQERDVVLHAPPLGPRGGG